ncbi:uncharacterized protein MELLADRAFT_104102 [Melampsora larici-populina 98AG31]|uniref:Uncharacterized protein n=1 Tax=Melampsora larici-populina (strain 98AG31 / pathotype 3-4-7) TaxID=747676 RepID=F4RDK1_MELLP|nr:uncharacterized protein MELLADRAFT_104102 [Melampsora larici-populina 98AG31]EGG09417.1 hypothetical protein MELLADRAFT_104102 [Melampsora larici-populina 98AG31]
MKGFREALMERLRFHIIHSRPSFNHQRNQRPFSLVIGNPVSTMGVLLVTSTYTDLSDFIFIPNQHILPLLIMKITRIQSTVTYFKKSATKAKKWLAVTANRFHRSRHGLSPPVSSEPSEKPLSRPSTPLLTTIPVPPPIPLIYNSVELSSLTTTPMFEPLDNSVMLEPLDNSVNIHTLPSVSRTSLTRSTASSGPSSTTISLMDIDTFPLLTPPFLRSHYETNLHDTPPPSTLTTFAESSEVLDVVTPEIESPAHNIIEAVRDIYRRSPTPTSQRPSAQLYVSLPPVQNPVTYLASRTARPYAYINRNILPPSPPASHSAKKRAFSVSAEDNCNVQAYKRYKLSSPGRLFLANTFPDLCSTRYDYGWSLHDDKVYVFSASCPTNAQAEMDVDGSDVQPFKRSRLASLDFRKRAFSESVHHEDTVQAYKRYKLSSPGRLFLVNIFTDLCSTRCDYGWSLHDNKVYVFSASCPTTAQAKINVDGSDQA